MHISDDIPDVAWHISLLCISHSDICHRAQIDKSSKQESLERSNQQDVTAELCTLPSNMTLSIKSGMQEIHKQDNFVKLFQPHVLNKSIKWVANEFKYCQRHNGPEG